jgi:hypothetical protein
MIAEINRKQCARCAQTFSSNAKRAIYCSKRCRRAAEKKRASDRTNPAVPGVCCICGEPFMRKAKAAPPKTCGQPNCVKEHKQNARRIFNRVYRKNGQMRQWKKNSDKKKQSSPDYIKAKQKAAEIAQVRQNKKDIADVPKAIDIVRKRIMVRDGLFRCVACKKTKHESECTRQRKLTEYARSGECKKCKAKYNKKHRAKNPERYRARAKLWVARRKESDPAYRMIVRYRNLTSKHAKRAGVQGCTKGRKLHYLGCTAKELADYLRNQWKRGMSWDNYGRKKDVRCWEIDHIVPVTAYDLSDDEQRCKAFHYTNLRPMWAKDNVKKGNRHWPKEHQPCIAGI